MSNPQPPSHDPDDRQQQGGQQQGGQQQGGQQQQPPAARPGRPATPPRPPAQPSGQPAQSRIPAQRATGAQTPPAAAQTSSAAQTPPARTPAPPGPAQIPPAAARPFVAQPPAATQPAATYTVPAIVAPWQQQQAAAAAGTTAAGTTAAGAAAAGTVAAGAAAGAAQAPAFPLTAVAPDDGPPRGTVLQSQYALRDARRRALSHRLTALHTGWHVVTTETLRRMNGASPGTGLILGVDQQRQPILVRLFRPAPTKVTLVGGVWAQRLLAFRALALGARVVLITTDPGAWHGFGELATGRSDRVALWNSPRPPVIPATAQQPALIIADTGAYGAAPLPEPRPWQTQLVVVRQLGADNVRALQDCHLVIMQRLAAPEASVAVQAMGLPDQSTRLLQVMGEDMLALLDGDTRYVWLSPTGVERQYNGAPRR